MEAMPNIQSRIVKYEMQNGTEVIQRRNYLVDENNKWRQIKNADAWAMTEASIDTYADLNITPEPVQLVTAADIAAANRPRRTEQLRVDRTATAAEATTEVPATVAASTVEPTAYEHATGLISWMKREAKSGMDTLKGAKRKLLAGAMGVLALGGVGLNFASASEGDFHRAAAATQEAPSTTPTTDAETTNGFEALDQAIQDLQDLADTAAPAPLTQAELEATYGGESTGEHTAHEIGFFNIDPANPDQSLQNLYSELRVNSDAQAFWNACLETGTPSYEVCVANPEVLANANNLSAEYRAMTLEEKAETAETLIDRFEAAEFKGITVENGTYKTVAVGSNGEFVASSNTRYEDPRLNFTFTIDGTEYDVQMRSCVQITESETPTPLPPTPPAEQPPVTTPPEETTTTTTPPEETTTTTTPEETTTTTAPEETTTTTSPPVTQPKTNPTYPAGENPNSTTVTVGELTPPEPTTSTVAPEVTQPTQPADTTGTSILPEIPIDMGPINQDTVYPGFLGVGSLWAVLKAKKKQQAAKKNA